MKTGIMGGTFNPIHNGHIYIAHALAKKFHLDRVIFIPAARPPHKDDTTLVSYEHRCEMVRGAIEPWPEFEVSDVEHPQRGTSYSVDTLKILHQLYPLDSLYFLMGMDSFDNLCTWHHYQQLFTLAHIVVACRPPTTNTDTHTLDKAPPQLPVAIRNQFCYDPDLNQYCHSSGQQLIFLEDTCMAISSTQIRTKLAANEAADSLMPTSVVKYIQAHHLYGRRRKVITLESDQRALLCAQFCLDRKALNMKVLHISALSSLTDYLVIASGTSDRQVQAIAESVRLGFKEQYNLAPIAVEGMNEGRWVLLDYGDVMVHVFQQPVREFYDLDGLWAEAPTLEIPEEQTTN